MSVHLIPPLPGTPPPALDAAQERAATWDEGHVLFLGGPGSGKSTAASAALRHHLERGAVLLSPTRLSAARAREAAAMWAPSHRALQIHTPSALAFSIVRAHAVAVGRPTPTLLTGAAQDEILVELLAGHADGVGVPLPWPPGLPREVVAIPAFRDELRDLFMRAAEFGLDGEDIAARGRELGIPEWELGGALYEEYRDVVSLADLPVTRGERYDSARILDEAATALRLWESFTDMPPPLFGRVIVDDYQEASAALVRLLHEVVRRGGELTLCADPDIAVQTFRGARPQFVARASHPGGLGGFGATVVTSPTIHRGSTLLRTAVEATFAMPAIAGGERRRATVRDSGGETLADRMDHRRVRAVELRTAAAEAAEIARSLRSAHLDRGLPWDAMAVVVRSRGAQEALVDALRRADVPARPDARSLILRNERAVAPLLRAVEVALALEDGADVVTAEHMTELLASPVGGMDPVALRRLRRHLRARVRTGEFEVLGEAVVAVSTEPEAARTLSGEWSGAAGRVAAMIEAARGALRRPKPGPAHVLWSAWEATGLAEHWQRRALQGGPAGERADDDLDAVITLLSAAESYAERLPGARPGQFVAWVRELSVPTDSLARTGQRPPGVVVVTAAEAAGREWPVVVVAGVQEGQWPDTRLRDTLLRAGQLADLELGRLGLGEAGDRRREVLDDEWRLFASAVSRAREVLVVTAVRGDELRPSVMFEAIERCVGGAERPERVERLDLRGVVAALRAELDRDPRSTASGVLAALAADGVPGASPREWAGAHPPTTMAPLAVDRVSPSKVESALTCPLRWALESVGGRAAARIEQNLGSLIHDIAAEYPHGTRDELLAVVEERFGELELPEGWIARHEYRRATQMIILYAEYAEGVPGAVESEVAVDVMVGDTRIVGRVDRVEHVDGGIRIADLKTGAPISAEAAAGNMQLATYQLAFGEQARGARLVYLSPKNKGAALRHQGELPDGGGWARESFDAAVTAMRHGEFEPVPNPGCPHCPVRTSCPAMDEGRRCAL